MTKRIAHPSRSARQTHRSGRMHAWNGWPNGGGITGQMLVEQVAEWRGIRSQIQLIVVEPLTQVYAAGDAPWSRYIAKAASYSWTIPKLEPWLAGVQLLDPDVQQAYQVQGGVLPRQRPKRFEPCSRRDVCFKRQSGAPPRWKYPHVQAPGPVAPPNPGRPATRSWGRAWIPTGSSSASAG